MGASRSDDAGDEKLMLAYAHGDTAAFDILYARHRGGVYRYVRRHCTDAATADEMFQDVWMRVIRGRESYAPRARFASWLYTLAHHRIVDHFRTRGEATLVSIDDDGAGADVDSLPGPRGDEPEARVARRRAAARLRAALAGLPPAQRDALLLQQESGLSLDEIAELTGVGAETVKSRLRYALAKLRAALPELREGA